MSLIVGIAYAEKNGGDYLHLTNGAEVKISYVYPWLFTAPAYPSMHFSDATCGAIPGQSQRSPSTAHKNRCQTGDLHSSGSRG